VKIAKPFSVLKHALQASRLRSLRQQNPSGAARQSLRKNTEMTRLKLKSGQTKASLIAVALLLCLSGSVNAAKSRDKVTVTGLVPINGHQLYYEMTGKGPTIVLIHGGLVDSRMWDDQFDAFARKGFRVIRYDLCGFGKSDFSMGPLSHVEDLHGLLTHLQVEKVSLIGLSLGGMIATDFALEHPEMVERLVLTSAALRGYQSPRNELTAAVYRAAEEQGMEKAIEMWLEHPFFVTGKSTRNYQRRIKQMLADNFRTWGPTPAPIKWEWPMPLTIERVATIRIPTLIIVGSEDAANILAIADVLQAKIAGASKVVMTGVGHHLNMEKPKEYNRVVLNFMSDKL
jgi:pimeloyl-ACP methyl ester carboxylesterase